VVVRYETAANRPATTAISVCADGVPRAATIPVPGTTAPLLQVRVMKSALLTAAAGPQGDAWFKAYLGRPVRLVYLDDPTRRPVDPEFGRPGDTVSFADGYPLLLTSTGSLDEFGHPSLRHPGFPRPVRLRAPRPEPARPDRVRRPRAPDRAANHGAEPGRAARRAARPGPRRPSARPRPGERRRAESQDHLVPDRHRRPRPRHRPRLRPAHAETGPTRLAGHGERRARVHLHPADAGEPPGGYGTWRFTTGIPGQPAWRIEIDPIAIDTCDHRFEACGHDPGAKLRHLAQILHATCTARMCRRPAMNCDFEHNIPFEAGGRTCLCNGGRLHQRCQVAGNWQSHLRKTGI
jgi:hypothetical protein